MDTATDVAWRLPAEWEPQDAVMIAWPYDGSDWTPVLRYAQKACAEIIATARQFQPVVLCVRSDDVLSEHSWSDPGGKHPVWIIVADYDDTWVRDTGPLTVFDSNGNAAWANFQFDGWGGRSDHPLDTTLTSRLSELPLFEHIPLHNHSYVLEGGAIESDGAGTLLTTARCWRGRDAQFSRRDVELQLAQDLGAQRVLWLHHGELLGDDTDSHIDMLARFAPDDTLVFQGCQRPQDPHYPFLQAMTRELEAFRTLSGRPYRLLELPMPTAMGKGPYRCPVTYANFMVLNNAVLVPTFEDSTNDEQAIRVISKAFPHSQVIGIDSRVLITQGGALHCASLQLPAGTLTVSTTP